MDLPDKPSAPHRAQSNRDSTVKSAENDEALSVLRLEVLRLRRFFRFSMIVLFLFVLWLTLDRQKRATHPPPPQSSVRWEAPTYIAKEPPSQPRTAGLPDADGSARDVEKTFQQTVERVAPTVVSLRMQLRTGSWRERLRRLGENDGGLPSLTDGSGVIIDPAGLILTNEHVVRDARMIFAGLADGRRLEAVPVGADDRADLALLRLKLPAGEELSLPAASFGDSDAIRVGQWALALGNPFGLPQTLTVGVISAKGRVLPSVRSDFHRAVYSGILQTDAAVNPGNSGGPLFNLQGEIIGINTMIYSQSGRSEGFGFAIPANEIIPLLVWLKKGLSVEYGWLGIRLQEFASEKEAFPNGPAQGALVAGVLPQTPAERAGLKTGMVIIAYDGRPVSGVDELIFAVGRTLIGRRVELEVADFTHSGARRVFTVRLGKRPPETIIGGAVSEQDLEDEDENGKAEAHVEPADVLSWRGLSIRELPDDEAKKRKAGLEIVGIQSGSPGAAADLFEGALIDEVKRADRSSLTPVKTLADFRAAVDGSEGPVALRTLLDGYVLILGKE
jgi:serine protease Do